MIAGRFSNALFVGLSFLTLTTASFAADETPVIKAPSVTVETVMLEEVVARTPVAGTLVSFEDVYVNTQINGLAIEEIHVEVGDRVDVGDTLLVLDNSRHMAELANTNAEMQRASAARRQAEHQVESTRATLRQADAVLERSERLKDRGSLSQALLDNAISSEISARASLASAQDGYSVATAQIRVANTQHDLALLNLARTRIKATASGIISQRSARVGAIASAGGEPLFVIIKDGLIEVEIEVIETALGDLEVGDLADFVVAGVGEVSGKVRMISPTVDARTRLGVVRVQLQSDPSLRIGIFASGWVTMDRYQALTVPIQAVLTDAEGEYVQVVIDNQIHRRTVEAGLVWQGRREIVVGLEPGETVLAKAGAFFREGDMVQPLLVGGAEK